jgi:hypothetical protein
MTVCQASYVDAEALSISREPSWTRTGMSCSACSASNTRTARASATSSSTSSGVRQHTASDSSEGMCLAADESQRNASERTPSLHVLVDAGQFADLHAVADFLEHLAGAPFLGVSASSRTPPGGAQRPSSSRLMTSTRSSSRVTIAVTLTEWRGISLLLAAVTGPAWHAWLSSMTASAAQILLGCRLALRGNVGGGWRRFGFALGEQAGEEHDDYPHPHTAERPVHPVALGAVTGGTRPRLQPNGASSAR